MTLKVISTEDILFSGEVSAVTLPGEQGEFTVLDHHAALISTLVPGTVSYTVGGEVSELQVNGGVVNVDNNIVSVCIF